MEENPTSSKRNGEILAVALISYANPMCGKIVILLMIGLLQAGPKMNAMSILSVLFNFGISFWLRSIFAKHAKNQFLLFTRKFQLLSSTAFKDI